MKGSTVILICSVVLLTSLLTVSIAINIMQDIEKKSLHHQQWVYNWSPNVQQFTFKNVTYHCVIVTREMVFVSTNATEAIQWALDYTDKWSWIWER